MNTAQAAVLEAVADIQAERNELRRLLATVVEGHTRTSRDDVALVQIPAGVMAEIRLRVEANA
jgi:hypothetical protein